MYVTAEHFFLYRTIKCTFGKTLKMLIFVSNGISAKEFKANYYTVNCIYRDHIYGFVINLYNENVRLY